MGLTDTIAVLDTLTGERNVQLNSQQLTRIADRWLNLLDQFNQGPATPSGRKAARIDTKLMLMSWHQREPLNFDVLERFDDANFAHDLGGIMRSDTLMSARSALAYHPTTGEGAQ